MRCQAVPTCTSQGVSTPGWPGGGHLSAAHTPTYLFTRAHITVDRGSDFEAVAQGCGFYMDNSLPLCLLKAADVLPTNILKGFHTHIVLALGGMDVPQG